MGVQLYQVGSGMKDRPLGAGGVVHETEEAIKQEMSEAWQVMRSERYNEMRNGMGKLKESILESCERGKAKEAVDLIVHDYQS